MLGDFQGYLGVRMHTPLQPICLAWVETALLENDYKSAIGFTT
jgi:hypothetical protein